MIIDYDKHSLIINNEKVVVRSAAFHYFRCPGEDAWRDRLSKIKAGGYNTVDLYFCAGFHSPKPGVHDFTGIRDIRKLLEIAEELGLFVIARPGPFINAEVSLGGLPYWFLNIPDIVIRNKKNGDYIRSEPYMKALKDWYSAIIPIINGCRNVIAFQIENEYFTNEAEPDYLRELYDLSRSLGIKIPIFHNDALSVGLYSDVVDIYAFDSYPAINLNHDWKDFPESFGVLDNAEENLGDACPNAPLFIAELQAGWFDKYGGIGYEEIQKHFKKEHINIVTKTALSQGITMFNHYMGCGGTSWGQIACSEVCTSYDFAAPISESGLPRENYYKAKEINYFLNAFNLASTDLIAKDGEITGEKKENIFAVLRQDNINNSRWLFIRNLTGETQNLKIADKYNLKINPTDMKILPLDLNLNACGIEFSSMEIFGRVKKDNYEMIFFIPEENGEIILNAGKTITAKELKDFDSHKFEKDGKTTEFIFITPETADKTWILEDKVIIGPDFLTENQTKAAFAEDTEMKILIPGNNTIWETKQIILPERNLEPELKNENIIRCAPEIDFNYDYSSWNSVKIPGKFDCVSNEIYDDYIWYKTALKHVPEFIEISAKHCYAIYLNGKQIYVNDSHIFEHGQEISETVTVKIDKKFANNSGQNELTVLVQNMGFDKGFQNELLLSRGILSLKTIPDNQKIEWRIKGSLTSENENNPKHSSQNSYLVRYSANFDVEENENQYVPLFLDLSEAEFNKADIYLNDTLVGRFWKSKGPQSLFYLPEEFLKPRNKLSITIWDRENNILTNHDYKFDKICVKIKIRNIKTFEVISV